jgi:hypothetical protein
MHFRAPFMPAVDWLFVQRFPFVPSMEAAIPG